VNRQSALLTIALVLLAVFATAFALINYSNSVKVWPLMTYQPLTLVIGVAFALGAGVGGLVISLLHHKHVQAPALNAPDALRTGSR
jgi:hypothetical protein